MAKNGLAKLVVATVVKKILGDCESEMQEIHGDVDRAMKERRAAAIRHRNVQIAKGNEAIRDALGHTAQGINLIRDQRNGDGVRNLVLEDQEAELRHRLKRDLTHSHNVDDDATADTAIEALVAEVTDEIVG